METGGVTRVLESLDRGEPLAAEQLLPLVYEELRRLAESRMVREASAHTLQPTALVHEAYLRLVGDAGERSWENRRHFFAAAAEAMRRILIEAARRKGSLKRGGDLIRVEFSEELVAAPAVPDQQLLGLDEALKKLRQHDREAYDVVMFRYFGGLTVDETAAALGISPRTVKRNWSYARAWLQRELAEP